MKHLCTTITLLAAGLVAGTQNARAEESFAKISEEVNKKVVKLFGAGGLKGLAPYGTGILVSPDGYILTVNSHILDTEDLRVHLSNGERYHAKVVAVEAELDVALVKIGTDKDKVEDLPYFDLAAAAKRPVAEAGTNVLAFSNQFEIATRDEPVSVMRGTVAAYSKLYGKIGIHDAPYTGKVYVVDAITNNPGAAGGPLTTRKGELIGLIGKELRNEQTNTWLNYAVPINARIDLKLPDKSINVGILDVVEAKEKYKPIESKGLKPAGGGGYSGIVLVPNVTERTPPYIDDVIPGSPAQKAGLKVDDLIVYVDGLPVISIQMYREVIDRYRPGDQVKVEVRRGEKLTTIPLTLLDKPKPAAPPKQ
jgi:serine protease Do